MGSLIRATRPGESSARSLARDPCSAWPDVDGGADPSSVARARRGGDGPQCIGSGRGSVPKNPTIPGPAAPSYDG